MLDWSIIDAQVSSSMRDVDEDEDEEVTEEDENELMVKICFIFLYIDIIQTCMLLPIFCIKLNVKEMICCACMLQVKNWLVNTQILKYYCHSFHILN